jgi:hypothetical protein
MSGRVCISSGTREPRVEITGNRVREIIHGEVIARIIE